MEKDANHRRNKMARERRGFVEGHDENIGKGEFANLPQDVKMESYPKARMNRGRELDDSMSDIDDVQGEADSKRDRYLSNQK